jgi:hypothetical protein
MTLFPILERELRSRAKTRANVWLRFGVAALGVLACLPQLLVGGVFRPGGSIGRYVFDGLIDLAFGLSCAACLLTADAISHEKREGTLGLLFLTHVRAFDILFAKLGSLGLNSFCALGAFLPMLMIPVLAGGVSALEAYKKGLVLLDTLLLALAVGLHASAQASERFKAARRALLLLLLLTVAMPLLDWMLLVGRFGHFFGLVSPLISLRLATDYPSTWRFWLSLVAINLMCWLLLFVAGVRLRGSVLEQEETKELQSRAKATAAGKNTYTACWSRSAANVTPISWLVSRQRGLVAAFWLAAIIGILYQSFWGVFLTRVIGTAFFRSSAYMLMQLPALTVNLVSGALVAWGASRFFVEGRRTGELELLLTTPQANSSIVSEQWKVLKRLLIWPLVLMLLPLLWRFLSVWISVPSSVAGVRHVYNPVMLVSGGLNIVFGTYATCWLGLWFGWRTRGQVAAIGWSVALSKGIPFLLSTFGMSIISIFFVGLGARGLMPFYYVVFTWMPQLLNLGLYFILIGYARKRLRAAFPEAPARSFQLSETLKAVRHWTPSLPPANEPARGSSKMNLDQQ